MIGMKMKEKMVARKREEDYLFKTNKKL